MHLSEDLARRRREVAIEPLPGAKQILHSNRAGSPPVDPQPPA